MDLESRVTLLEGALRAERAWRAEADAELRALRAEVAIIKADGCVNYHAAAIVGRDEYGLPLVRARVPATPMF